MQTYYCRDGCCTVKIQTYKKVKRQFNSNYKKAGVFIYDPKKDKVLLVQSRGHLWGPPKGTRNVGELVHNCAIREVKEETGLNISSEDFTKSVNVRKRAIYFYLEMDAQDLDVQNSIDDNDANGITWMKVKCLENAISDGNIVLNHYAKIVFYKFLGKTFPKSNWILVSRRKNVKEGDKEDVK